MTDTYKTVAGVSEGLFRDRGSRFISFIHNVTGEEEIKEILASYRKKYHDARHHCYAWQTGVTEKRYRSNDDGEPSGTAGKPILAQIQGKELTNVLIVVIRYFGGTLLGTGGLINAYRSAASDAISKSVIVEKILSEQWKIEFGYELMNEVMKIIKDENLAHSRQEFGLKCSITVICRKSATAKIRERFSRILGVEIFIEGEC